MRQSKSIVEIAPLTDMLTPEITEVCVLSELLTPVLILVTVEIAPLIELLTCEFWVLSELEIPELCWSRSSTAPLTDVLRFVIVEV